MKTALLGKRMTVTVLTCLAVSSTLAGCITFTIPRDEASPESSSQPSANVEQPSEDWRSTAGQSVDFSISGGCQESYEAIGTYSLFEEFGDDCYLVVEVFPPEPARRADLQYFDSTWITESSLTTDSSGIAYLPVDPYCDDGFWCTGSFEYRLFVEGAEYLPAERSVTFELEFIQE